jgi:hypothetical protein
VQRSFARLVTRQGGVFTRDQALQCYSGAEVRAHLRRRHWRRTPWPGLYADGELPDDVPTLIRAAALWLGGDLVACHTTAALLWGFDIRAAASAVTQPLHFLGPPDMDNRAPTGLRVPPPR